MWRQRSVACVRMRIWVVCDRTRLQVNTYLSRDGGLTWVEAHKGALCSSRDYRGGFFALVAIVFCRQLARSVP